MEQQCFSSLKNQKKLLLSFCKIMSISYKNGNAKIINLLNSSENEYSKFATKRLYIIDSDSKGNYSQENPIKFLTKSIESNLCDYSHADILGTENIAVTGGNANTKVAFKNCAPFNKCRTEINDTFVGEADFINIAMSTQPYNVP